MPALLRAKAKSSYSGDSVDASVPMASIESTSAMSSDGRTVLMSSNIRSLLTRPKIGVLASLMAVARELIEPSAAASETHHVGIR